MGNNEKKDRFDMADLRDWAHSLPPTQQLLFLGHISRIASTEIDGVSVCTDAQLEDVFRGTSFHGEILGVINGGEMPRTHFEDTEWTY